MKNKGITLIALVVTIVVLLILAGVSITAVFGEGGIIALAQEAADKTKEAEEKTLTDLNDVVNKIGEITGTETGTGGTGGSTGDQPDPPTLNTPQIKDSVGKVLSEDSNTTVYDEYNNPVEVPAGFAIVPNGKNNVEYNYTGNGTPSVQDGIVITDQIDAEGNSTGNEFVWIPVSTEERNIKDKNNGETEITLGRYTFDYITGTGTPSDPKTDGTTLEDEVSANEYTEDTNNGTGKSSKGNAVAKDINVFTTSANEKGGYYLARYEAGVTNYDEGNIKTRNDEKDPNWTGYQAKEGTTLKLVSKKGQQVWNYITQNRASAEAKAMYPENNNYTSDLVNSYAWDTAIVFIQKYSISTGYSGIQGTDFSLSLRNTGAGTGADRDKIDKKCNVYDMAGNCDEWTTETAHLYDQPCVSRGGTYYSGDPNTSNRCIGITSYDFIYRSFRSVLCVE